MKSLLLFMFILTIASGFNCWSQVRISCAKNLVLPADVSEPMMTTETARRLQPKSVAAGDSESSVISKIADNSLSFLWDNSGFKNTSVGRAAEKVEKNLKMEMNFTDSSPSKTQHKFAFKILALQALAKLEYKGWLNAALNYNARSALAEAEVSEKIFKQQDFVFTFASTREETKSQVALRWNW